MYLDRYSSCDFDIGASFPKQVLWFGIGNALVSSWLPGSAWRAVLLRAFGAQIGIGCVFKPRIQIKFPWRLELGSSCWVGEAVWIDNLATVTLGDNVCVSQGAYICTGSHDWAKPTFDLVTRPVTIQAHVWVGAKAVIAPGSVLEEGAVLTLGSIAIGRLRPWTIHHGSPASAARDRENTRPQTDQ